jgi:hypothetical protein
MPATQEIIDPGERRRRRLRPTLAASEEQKWHQQKILEITESSSRALSSRGDRENLMVVIKKTLLSVSASNPSRN